VSFKPPYVRYELFIEYPFRIIRYPPGYEVSNSRRASSFYTALALTRDQGFSNFFAGVPLNEN